MKQSVLSKLVIFLVLIVLNFVLTSCLTKKDQSPPTTTILNPPNGATLSDVVQIRVTSSDERAVTTTKLFIDGLEVSTVQANELVYEWDTRPIADNRDHHISAYAIDDSDNIGPSAIHTVRLFTLVNDTLPQVVTIQNPLNGQTVSGTVNIAVGVDREINNPVDSVVVYVDGARFASKTGLPYLFEWNTSNLINGSDHTIFAIAYDRFGYNVSSSVTTVTVISDIPGNIVPPVATIENPINGQIVSGVVNMVTHVENLEYNAVDSVVFVVDGFRLGRTSNFPYTFPWDATNLPNTSQHTIFSVVYDQLGFNVSSDVVRVSVQSNIQIDDAQPVVTIIFPDPNVPNVFSKSVVGNNITIVADAMDDSGIIEKVEFYIDGIFQAEDTSPLYEYNWDLTNVTSGIDHTIYVRAFDAAGNIGAAFLGVRIED